MPKKTKVYALVSGGVLQDVWATDPDIKVFLIDEDDGDHDEPLKEHNEKLLEFIEKHTKAGKLHQVAF